MLLRSKKSSQRSRSIVFALVQCTFYLFLLSTVGAFTCHRGAAGFSVLFAVAPPIPTSGSPSFFRGMVGTNVRLFSKSSSDNGVDEPQAVNGSLSAFASTTPEPGNEESSSDNDVDESQEVNGSLPAFASTTPESVSDDVETMVTTTTIEDARKKGLLRPLRPLRPKLRKLFLFWRDNVQAAQEMYIDEDYLGSSYGTPRSKSGSVFDESKAMLTLSDMIYAFSSLRSYARRQGDKELLHKLRVPQISSTLTPAIIDNIHLLKGGSTYGPSFIERASQTVNRDEYVKNSNLNSELICFGDDPDDCKNSCVYGVAVNRSKKRFSVWFRGTVMDGNGLKTWQKNLDTTMRHEENPIDEMLETLPVFYLHRGFARAILGRRRRIILKILEYKKKHPETKDYQLVVSGHSLGGSLATLFGFYACQEPEFTENGPVRVYTFAAPPVGCDKFAKVFRRLEDDDKIQLARIHNSNDPVPHTFAMTRYAHVGLGIELSFPGYEVVDEDRSSAWKGRNIFRVGKEHKLQTSYEHMNRHSVAFNKTLDEMYCSQRGNCKRATNK